MSLKITLKFVKFYESQGLFKFLLPPLIRMKNSLNYIGNCSRPRGLWPPELLLHSPPSPRDPALYSAERQRVLSRKAASRDMNPIREGSSRGSANWMSRVALARWLAR